MSTQYFSDRERGPKPRVEEDISEPVWAAIRSLIMTRVANSSFGNRYPEKCSDGNYVCGCDADAFQAALSAIVADDTWTLRAGDLPSTFAILDAIEFCFASVAEPSRIGSHSYFSHDHLSFDAVAGRAEFRADVNEIFARNRLQFELDATGTIIRLGSEVFRNVLLAATFNTGDSGVDSLLETAREKYLDPSPSVRQEGLEKLWDAWEGLKTIEPGKDKKVRATALLDKVAKDGNVRALLDTESRALTNIGNDFHIRHTETYKPTLDARQVDYLFHRMFAFIWLILVETDRTG